MRHDGAVAGVVRSLHSLQRLGQGADLVDLDQDGVGHAALDAVGQARGVGDEQIVAHELHLAAERLGQRLPAVPVVLGHAVLDGQDGETLHQALVELYEAGRIERLPLAFHDVFAALVEFGRGGIEAQRDLFARLVARALDGLHDEVERGLGAGQVGREAAFVADVGVVAGVVKLLLQRVEDFGSDPHGLRERGRGNRQDHELLEVDRIVRVRAAVDDVHHRHRQGARMRAADIAVERQVRLGRRRLGHRQADAQDCVGAQARLVLGAVQLDHRGVERFLLARLQARDSVEDLAVDGIHGLAHALAAIALLVAVAQFDRLMRAGRGAGRHGRTPLGAGFQRDIHLDGGIAPAVQDFTGAKVGDAAHVESRSVEGGKKVSPAGWAGPWPACRRPEAS